MREYRVYHVIGERPVSVEFDGRAVEIPAEWLIFNAPRPLYASPVEVVIREAMRIGDFDYPEKRGELYLDWRDAFLHGIFYVAVDPTDDRKVDDNVSLDGWVLEYHSLDEVREWARAFYKGMGVASERIESELSENVRGVARSFLDQLNGQ